MNHDSAAQPERRGRAAPSAAAALDPTERQQLIYQAVALGGAGLQLLLGRGPLTLRRGVEAVLLWELIVDLGHAVMTSQFSVQRDGLRWSLVAGIGGAGLLGVWANALSRRHRRGRRRAAMSPFDLEVAGIGVPQATLDAIGQRATHLMERVAGVGAELASLGMAITATGGLAATRADGRAPAVSPAPPPSPPSAWQALTPALHAGLLALYTLTRREQRAAPPSVQT
jgi:hypothetical protein